MFYQHEVRMDYMCISLLTSGIGLPTEAVWVTVPLTDTGFPIVTHTPTTAGIDYYNTLQPWAEGGALNKLQPHQNEAPRP